MVREDGGCVIAMRMRRREDGGERNGKTTMDDDGSMDGLVSGRAELWDCGNLTRIVG